MLNWKVATTYRDLHGLLEAALTTYILLIIVVIVIVVVVVVVVPRLLWLHAIPCLPYNHLPSPSSSAFFLAADNQQLPRPFANFNRRPIENNYKDMDKYKYRVKEKCKIRQPTGSIPKVKLKRKMSSSGKKLFDVINEHKVRKFAIALALSSNAHFKNILLFFRQCGQMMFSSTADKTRPR